MDLVIVQSGGWEKVSHSTVKIKDSEPRKRGEVLGEAKPKNLPKCD